MIIMVFDVPAVDGGALSVLQDFYFSLKSDNLNTYIFVISKPELQETSNIKVLNFPWIKKSWVHRLYFDHLVAPKLVRKYGANEVLSLQNVTIPHVHIPQTIFVHNAIPFSEFRFSLFSDFILWIYQNIIGHLIFRSIKKANIVSVQTHWMKKKCIEKLRIEENKVIVCPPKLDIEIQKRFNKKNQNIATFFYPASGMVFKNHQVIVNTCLALKKEKIENYNVIFTLNTDENSKISKLNSIIHKHNLPVKFVGHITRNEVFEYYSKSILLFPSFLETVGLPLIEAKEHHSPIIVSDCEYAHEIMEDYEYVKYFNPFNVDELKTIMIETIKGFKV